MTRLAECRYFTADRFNVESEVNIFIGAGSFVSMTAVEGAGQISGTENTVDFRPGDTMFIPAGSGAVTVRGKSTLIAVGVKGE